jgi:predicted protein tyrosine phosphatase
MSKLLFVCSRNQWRSPTAEKVFRELGYSARSAGTSPNAKHTISAKDIQWADIILVMESKHRDRIKASFRRVLEHKKICVLDIPDEYQFMDEELVELCMTEVLAEVEHLMSA